jgi:hypothetical protein
MGARPCLWIFILAAGASLTAGAEPPEQDPAAACRAAHGNDPAAHIQCLEAALQARDGKLAQDDDRDGTEPPTGIGAEQVLAAQKQSERSKQSVDVRIVSASYDSTELGTFRLANGQVWRETGVSPQRKRLRPGTEYTARIEPGPIGGYRMRVDGVRWMKTVERIQ